MTIDRRTLLHATAASALLGLTGSVTAVQAQPAGRKVLIKGGYVASVDPNIGEIRDGETAQIAVQAALTGHLVLSTLHTNSAAAAVTRLRDMGVEDYLLTAVLRGIMAQRLVRRLCPDCRRREPAGEGRSLLARALLARAAAPAP